MRLVKLVLPLLISLATHGCDPVWASSELQVDSNFQILSEGCQDRYVSVILSHDLHAVRDPSGNVRFPESSEMMLLPCDLLGPLHECTTHRGRFHWSTGGQVFSSLKGDAFQCLAD